MTPFCANCGSQIEENWNSCPECGSDLNDQKIDGGSQPVTISPQTYQPPPPQSRPTYTKPTVYSQTSGANGYGIASLVCGIIGLFVAGCIFGIIAIILGAIGKTNDDNPGMATGGLVIGIIDLCCGLFSLFFLTPLLFIPFY